MDNRRTRTSREHEQHGDGLLSLFIKIPRQLRRSGRHIVSYSLRVGDPHVVDFEIAEVSVVHFIKEDPNLIDVDAVVELNVGHGVRLGAFILIARDSYPFGEASGPDVQFGRQADRDGRESRPFRVFLTAGRVKDGVSVITG